VNTVNAAPTPPRGTWIAASVVLGREVSVREIPTPHICGRTLTGLMTGRRVDLSWRDCAACAERSPR
jgi:hypothetical protein